MLEPGASPERATDPAAVWSRVAGHVTADDAELIRAANYMFRSRIADRWRHGRVLLAGDAAHGMPPFLGQGMCSGIRDGHNLAWKLDFVLTGGAGADILDTYQAERAPYVRCIDGSFLPQGRVRFGGRDGLFDDVVGHGWRIVAAEPSLLDRLTAPDRDAWAAIGGRTAALTPPQDGSGLDDTEGVYRAWFRSHGCKAVVVRPDWYAYGTADDAEGLAGLLGQLARSLRGELPAA